MSIWGCVIFISIYLLIIVGLTRMRAELGPPIQAVGYVTPQYLTISMFGTRRLRAGESDDAFHVELVERRELRIVSDASDARSDGSVQTR